MAESIPGVETSETLPSDEGDATPLGNNYGASSINKWSLEKKLEERSLLWYSTIWSLPMLMSLYICVAHFIPSIGACSRGSSCAQVRESVFGQIFGLPLATLGPFFYAVPFLAIYMLSVARKAGNEQAQGFCWLFLYEFTLFTFGFEIYLVYAQFLLEAYCMQCMFLAIAAFGAVAFTWIVDRMNSDWERLCLWPKSMIVVFAFILIHFIMHPTGSYDHRFSPVALKKMERAKLRQETLSQIYEHPYEAEPYGVRKSSKLIVSDAEFDSLLPELDDAKVDILIGDDFAALKGGDLVKEGEQVMLAHHEVETSELYPVRTYLGNRTEGSVDAPVKMILYADYGCLNCENFEKRELPQIREALIDTGKLHLTYRYYDTKSFQFSDFAAKVAAAASFQGKEVWRNVHQRLFETRRKWSLDGDASSYVSDLVNLPEMSAVLSDYDQLDALLKKEHHLAVEAGVGLAPSVSLEHGRMTKPELFNGYSRARTIIEIVEELITEYKEAEALLQAQQRQETPKKYKVFKPSNEVEN